MIVVVLVLKLHFSIVSKHLSMPMYLLSSLIHIPVGSNSQEVLTLSLKFILKVSLV